MGKSRKSFKEAVEQHPLTSLVIAASATVASTFGVMTYLHQAETKLQDLETVRKIAIQSQEYEKKVGYLEGRLASIDRRVSPDRPAYFDVTTLITTPDAIRALDKSFTFFADLNCYIAIPTTTLWTHEITDELRLASMLSGQEIPKDNPLSAFAAGSKLHLWKGPESFEVNTGNDDIPKLHLFPFVMIQSVENSQFARAIGKAAVEQSEHDNERSNEVKEILNRLKAKDGHTESKDSPVPPTASSPSPATTPNLEAEKLEITESLERIFRSDFAGFFLFSQLTVLQGFQQIPKECSVELTSAEKKGNVLYCHFHITIIDSLTKVPTYWDRELFFVSGTKRSFIVATSAPSLDRRSASATWITSWLSSLRVPLE